MINRLFFDFKNNVNWLIINNLTRDNFMLEKLGVSNMVFVTSHRT